MTDWLGTDPRASLQLHDAELVGLEIDRERQTIMLRFSLPHGCGVTTLAFSGVSHFRALDVIPQNVVSRILLSDASKLSQEQILYWIEWVSSLTNTTPFSDEAGRQQILEQILQQERLLFVLDPSWGAEIVIICSDMSYETKSA